jgi:MFS family permease
MPSSASALKLRNIRCFVAFRLFFNARFYYPVFAILFLDFGLSLQQFALLNVVWAAAIVIMEVPSGALADIIGRKKLLVVAGWLMVAEMALLCFAPRGDSDLLFLFFLLNRICSGAAEAAASGADESLAYDTLTRHQATQHWGAVLARQMRLRSMGSVIVLSVGAALYDPAFVQRLCGWMGVRATVTQDMTLRIPLVLTLCSAVITLIIAYAMQETEASEEGSPESANHYRRSVRSAFKLTFQAGRWIARTPFALVLILVGVTFDNVVRVAITLGSQYYRLIAIPEAAFGLIGAGMAGIGILVPALARRMTAEHTPVFNVGILAAMTLAGLIGMAGFIPWFGLIPMVSLMAAMYLLNFFLSHYLNRITESGQRATVLSFRGLFFNLAYGVSGMLYAVLLAALRPGLQSTHPQMNELMLKDLVFRAAMVWFPWYFAVLFIATLIYAKHRLRQVNAHRQVG